MNAIPRSTMFDTLVNFVSSLGTMKDKATATRFTLIPLTRDQIDAGYRGDWIARKVIDIPAKDATREWRDWQADSGDIEVLEQVERQLNLQNKLRRAMTLARLYGGGVMVMGVADQDAETELDPESVKKDDLKYVHVLGRYELSTGPIIWDVMSPWYGEPEWYARKPGSVAKAYSKEQQAIMQTDVKIHPSRVVRLVGNEFPDLTQSDAGWGDSVLQCIYEAILNAGTVANSTASLVHENKIDIISIPDLSTNIMTDEYKTRLMNRFSNSNVMKSMINTMVLDKEETWTRVNANFAGLQPLIRDYLSMAAGAADIPATRLLGESPRGMNATGVSDIRNYYDKIASDQETDLTPAMSRLDEVLIRSATGKRDSSIFYEWTPLWQLDETQKGALWLAKAQTYQIDVNAGQIPADALAQARENQLIEDGVYPGLEQAIEDAQNQALLEQFLTPPEPPPALPAPTGGAPQLPPPAGVPPTGAQPPPVPPARSTPATQTGDRDPFHHSEKQPRQRGRFKKANQLRAMRASFEEHITEMRKMMNEHLAQLEREPDPKEPDHGGGHSQAPAQ
jgi:uncharacterized protein